MTYIRGDWKVTRGRVLAALLTGVLICIALYHVPVRAQSDETSSVEATGRPIVATAEGPVAGSIDGQISVFRGIPYAAAPTGDLRWQPPQPVVRWTRVRDASRWGNTCAQVTTIGLFAGPPSVSEDCLYLNVFTSETHVTDHKKPVIVWFHGGGNIDGESNDYDGAKLATGGPNGVPTVVVTVNYRLGLFGTFAHPAINGTHESGNYGILDQQAALRWVQRNIEAFGGDPAKVMIAGQSAGAADVGVHLLSPSSKGLFSRAIMESSPGFVAWLPPADATQAAGVSFASAAGCPDTNAQVARCLRALPTARILELQGTLRNSGLYTLGFAYVDGTLIPLHPEQAWTSGAFNQVPVMGGGTKDEAAFFTGTNEYFAGPPHLPITPAQYAQSTTTGAFCVWCNAERTMPAGIAERYPLSDYAGDPMVAYERIGTDAARCREVHVLQKIAAHVPVFAYDFRYSDAPYYFPKMPGYRPMAVHTIDLQFLFTGFHGSPLGVNADQRTGTPRDLNEAEAWLSDRMVAAWTHFADTGNPNGHGNAPWPAFDGGPHARYLIEDLSMSTTTVSEIRRAYKCDFYDAQLAY